MSQLVQAFTAQRQLRPEQWALSYWHAQTDKRRHFSNAELGQQVLRMASGLGQLAQPGERVLLLFEPGPEFAMAFWACLCAGVVAVPTYPPADPRTRSRFLDIAKDAEATVTLTTDKILKQSRLVRWFVGSLRRMRWSSVEQLQKASVETLPDVSEQALALLQYTSGSTARPRGVMLSHANVFANIQALDASRAHLGAERRESFVCWLPLYHDMGLISGVVMPLALGHQSTLLSPLHFLQKPVRWLQAIHDSRGSISAGPNFAFELCCRKVKDKELKDLDLSSWAVILNGAERILPETLQQFVARFAPCGVREEALYPSYGLAESTVFVSGPPAGSAPLFQSFDAQALRQHKVIALNATDTASNSPEIERLVGVGCLWNQAELAIVDPKQLSRCADDQVGEIWLRGPSVGQGYWQRPELNTEHFEAQIAGETDRWFRTGDLGFLWQGQLFITGRIKEILILHGQNYHPQPLERAIQNQEESFRPGNAAAFSVGHQAEKLVIVQEVRAGVKKSPQALEQAAREALRQDFALPLHDFVLLQAGDLPKTSSGKIQRGRAREMYLKGKFKPWKP